MLKQQRKDFTTFHETPLGQIIQGDSREVLATYGDESVDLVMTSPPFGLVRKKEYGNVAADEYVDWFKSFAAGFHRVLKDNGSLVIDIGGVWNKGYPTRHLYHFKFLVMLCEEFGFHLAQDFYWWNPSKLPTPAEWVTVRRVRVKDAVNTVWWLSKTPWPKASNRRVLQPYSSSMQELLAKGCRAKKRPSGHDISEKFSIDNGAAIPPNLIAIPNTESNSFYLRYCEKKGLKPHPDRFPSELPEYFIRMLTEPDDLVIDPFAGSCVTGEICERIDRRWACIELLPDYCQAALGRFVREPRETTKPTANPGHSSNYYRVPRPGILWNGDTLPKLAENGGKRRLAESKDDKRNTIVPDSETAAPDYRKYADCMEEIKKRTAAIDKYLVGGFHAGCPQITAESVFLQIRKILELIALASLVANQREYAKQRKNFCNDWNAKRILETLEKANPNYYPTPVEQLIDSVTGRVLSLKAISSGYLTKEDFVVLFDRCNGMLHAENPFSRNQAPKSLLESVPMWTNKIIRLLNHHTIQLLNDDKQLWVQMVTKPYDKAQVCEFERVFDGGEG